MRKIIEVDKFFVNSVFFMKKTCFFRISNFTLQIFLNILRICSFGTRSRIQHPKSGQRPLKRRGRLQSHYTGTLALWRKDGGVIIGRRVTGRKARTGVQGSASKRQRSSCSGMDCPRPVVELPRGEAEPRRAGVASERDGAGFLCWSAESRAETAGYERNASQ